MEEYVLAPRVIFDALLELATRAVARDELDAYYCPQHHSREPAECTIAEHLEEVMNPPPGRRHVITPMVAARA